MKLIFLLAVFLLFSIGLPLVESVREVGVREDGMINVSVDVKNTGTDTLSGWIVGVDYYKVFDYNNIPDYSQVGADKDTVRTGFFRAKEAYQPGTGSYCNIKDEGYDCGCDYDRDLWGWPPPELLSGENVTVNCSVPASRFGPTKGNQRIMFWIHERDEYVDIDGDPDTSVWWYEALSRQEPASIMVNILENPDVDVVNSNLECGNNPNFILTVQNHYPYDLTTTIKDELYEGDVTSFVFYIEQCIPYWNEGLSCPYSYTGTWMGEWTDEVTIPAEGTWTGPDPPWSPDPAISLDHEKFYYHKVTVGDIVYDFVSPFYCYDRAINEYLLKVDAKYNSPDRTADQFVIIEILDEFGSPLVPEKKTFAYPSAQIPLEPGNYQIKVQEFFYSHPHGNRYFSHILDHDYNGYDLDTDDNPYAFTMSASDREMTVFYKSFTKISNLEYDGKTITGYLTEEEGGALEEHGNIANGDGTSTPVTIKRVVDLFYEKDGSWQRINCFADSDPITGQFTCDFECKPGMKKIRASYTPSYWYYQSSSHEMKASCDLDIVKIGLSDGITKCVKECSGGQCTHWTMDDVCPTFECGENIILKVIVQNKGTFDFNGVKVKAKFAEVNDVTGEMRRVKEFDEEYIGGLAKESSPTSPINFEVPASAYATMTEGWHLGFWVEVKDLEYPDIPYFASVGDDSPNPPPRVDNSDIYSVSCCPIIGSPSCDATVVEVGKKFSCSVDYTHLAGETGVVHFHWLRDFALYPTAVYGCKNDYYVIKDAGGYRYLECDVDDGGRVTLEIVPQAAGTFDMSFRARDKSIDMDCGGGRCDYSRDPDSPLDLTSGTCSLNCDKAETEDADIINCDSYKWSVTVNPRPTPPPDCDLEVAGIQPRSSGDSMFYIDYSKIVNKGGTSQCTGSSATLEKDETGEPVVTETQPLQTIDPLEVKYVGFATVWECLGETDTVKVTASSPDDIDLSNNELTRTITCPTTTTTSTTTTTTVTLRITSATPPADTGPGGKAETTVDVSKSAGDAVYGLVQCKYRDPNEVVYYPQDPDCPLISGPSQFRPSMTVSEPGTWNVDWCRVFRSYNPSCESPILDDEWSPVGSFAVTTTTTTTTTTLPHYSDLVIGNIENVSGTIEYEIGNQGDESVQNPTVSGLYIGDGEVDTTPGSEYATDIVSAGLEPSTSLTRNFGDWECVGEDDNVTVCADINDAETEKDETNNCGWEVFICPTTTTTTTLPTLCYQTCDMATKGGALSGRYIPLEQQCEGYEWDLGEIEGQRCCCIFSCSQYIEDSVVKQCPSTDVWCLFDYYVYDKMDTPKTNTLQGRYCKDFEEFLFQVRETLNNVHVTMTPTDGDYDLYVLWDDVWEGIPNTCPREDPEDKYDCAPKLTGDAVEDCDTPSVSAGKQTRIIVYNRTEDGTYTLSITADEITPAMLAGKEVLVPTETTTTTTTVTTIPEITTTVKPTTTTTPARRRIAMDLVNALRQFFERYFGIKGS